MNVARHPPAGAAPLTRRQSPPPTGGFRLCRHGSQYGGGGGWSRQGVKEPSGRDQCPVRTQPLPGSLSVVVRARLALPFKVACAWLGICLAGLDNEELFRFAMRQRGWGLVWSMISFPLYVVGGIAWGFGSDVLYLSLWLPGALLSTAALFTGLYARAMLAGALLDRSGDPIAAKGTLRRVIPGRDGGWPVLMRDQNGRGLWLTGREADLHRAIEALERRRPGVQLELSITLTYYPRTHVIKEISGIAVQEREKARATAASLAPSPT